MANVILPIHGSTWNHFCETFVCNIYRVRLLQVILMLSRNIIFQEIGQRVFACLHEKIVEIPSPTWNSVME